MSPSSFSYREKNLIYYIYCCRKEENLFTSTFFSSRNGLVSGLADQYKSPSKYHTMIKKIESIVHFFFFTIDFLFESF